MPYWHDDMGSAFFQAMQTVDAFLLGRRTYEIHANAFEPMAPGDVFGDLMNAPKKYVVSRTLTTPIWRDTTIIRDDVVAAVRALKAQPGRDILTDGSSGLVPTLIEHDLVDELQLSLYPVTLGGGKRILPAGVRRDFQLTSATPYPTGVVGLRYARRAS
jgi:dihydrofolate reductase